MNRSQQPWPLLLYLPKWPPTRVHARPYDPLSPLARPTRCSRDSQAFAVRRSLAVPSGTSRPNVVRHVPLFRYLIGEKSFKKKTHYFTDRQKYIDKSIMPEQSEPSPSPRSFVKWQYAAIIVFNKLKQFLSGMLVRHYNKRS